MMELMNQFDRAWHWERDRARIVWLILVVTVATYILQVAVWNMGGAAWILRELALSRVGVRSGRLWQFVTYQLLHGGIGHLLMNMIALALLGPDVARAVGPVRFAILYMSSGVLGGLGYVLLDHHPCLGASGAVFGVMAAFATLHPRRPMMLLVLPFFTLPAWAMVLGIMILELLYLMQGFQGGVAHSAHLAGAVTGAVYTRVMRGCGCDFAASVTTWWRRRRKTTGFRRGCETHEPEAPEIDRILDKIAQGGMNALTREERDLLDAASRRLRGWKS